jgi:hypothetical protein
MMKAVKWIGSIITALLIILAIYVFGILVPQTDADKNRVTPHAPYPVSDKARALHDGF